MFNKKINAEEIYIFSEQCIKVQKENMKLLDEEITQLEKEAKKIKNAETKKKVLARKNRAVTAKKEANEKIDYLINTCNIILGVYEKNGKKFNISKKIRQKFEKKYDFLGEYKNDKK